MRALARLFRRELALAWSGGGGPLLALGFYAAVTTLIPLATSPDPRRLAGVATGVAWVALALAWLALAITSHVVNRGANGAHALVPRLTDADLTILLSKESPAPLDHHS